MSPKFWKKSEINFITENKDNMTISKMAEHLNRSLGSVDHKIRSLSLKRNIDRNITHPKPIPLQNSELQKLSLQIAENIYDNYKLLKLNIPYIYKSSSSKREEHSILDLSDIHIGMYNEVFDSDIGKNIVTYNHNIFKKELEVLINSVLKIHDILSQSYSLKKLTINLMGDIVTNDRIFEEQVFEIEKVVGLQVWDAINYLIYLIVSLLKVYEKIDVVCVVGNHGRSLPDSYEEPVQNNFEFFVYKMLEKQFANNKRVKIVVPDSRRFIYKIYNWKHLIEHGDSLRGSSSTGIEKQIKDLSINVGGFDILHFGHFHKLKEDEISDKVIVKQNGCWIYKDNYAFKKYKYYSIPKQWFFGCNEHRPETWAYKLDLRTK